MASLVEKAVIDTNNAKLLIDGQEFPWLVANGGVEVIPGIGGIPILRVDILAERIICDSTVPAPSDAETCCRHLGCQGLDECRLSVFYGSTKEAHDGRGPG